MSAAATYMCRQFVEDVTAYLDGALPESVVAIIDGHLADCPHCREYLQRDAAHRDEDPCAQRRTTSTPCPPTCAIVCMQAFRERDE